MNLDQLRKRHAAKQHHQAIETKTQAVELHANPNTGQVFLKFSFASDHLLFTLPQAMDHAYKVISAASACGAKFDMKALEDEMARGQAAVTANAKKAD